jgi:hypothetical protein
MYGKTSGVSSLYQNKEKRSYQYTASSILVSPHACHGPAVYIFICGITLLYSAPIKSVDTFHQHIFHPVKSVAAAPEDLKGCDLKPTSSSTYATDQNTV